MGRSPKRSGTRPSAQPSRISRGTAGVGSSRSIGTKASCTGAVYVTPTSITKRKPTANSATSAAAGMISNPRSASHRTAISTAAATYPPPRTTSVSARRGPSGCRSRAWPARISSVTSSEMRGSRVTGPGEATHGWGRVDEGLTPDTSRACRCTSHRSGSDRRSPGWEGAHRSPARPRRRRGGAVRASASPAAAALTTDCDHPSGSQVFARWLDPANYFLAPDGGFENGGDGWDLDGARVVAGNETFDLGGPGTRSLRLPAGSSATSPEVCVGVEHPSFRYVFRRTAGPRRARLRVSVVLHERNRRAGRYGFRIVVLDSLPGHPHRREPDRRFRVLPLYPGLW